MTDFVCSIIEFVGKLLSGFPTFDMASSNLSTISSSLNTVLDFINQANFIIPLSDILIIIGIDLTIRVTKFLIFIINWIIRRVVDVIP